jgi:glycosyltransferase involved in cell wall biosynthesis
LDTEFEAVLGYARALGLKRFVFCGEDGAVQYALDDAGSYQPTRHRPRTTVDKRGRRRMTFPPDFGGHVLTRSPELANSVSMNLDILKRGYLYVHLITTAATERTWSLRRLLGAVFVRIRQRVRTALRLAKSRPRIFSMMAAPREPAYSVVPNRILMITPSFARGGSEQQTFNTAELLVKRGYEVCMLALRPLEPGEPGYMDEIDARGLAFRVLSNSSTRYGQEISPELRPYADGLPPWLVSTFDSVIHVIRDFRPAVIHCWLDHAIVLGGLPATVLGAPRIIAHQLVTLMDDPRDVQQFWRDGYLALVRNHAVTFSNNSKAGAVGYERWLGFRQDTIRVLPNVLSPSTLRTPAAGEVARFRASLGIGPKDRVVATIIRLVPQKDPELWVDAAAAIAALRSDVRFLIGGYGILEDAVRRKIRNLKLEERITVLGAVTDLGLVYAAMDIFMLSSRFEGLPCVLLEAQTAGRPVVATDVGGNSEAIRDGVTGRVVRQRSAGALARAVLDILDDPDWAARAATEAPRYVEATFGPESYVEKTLELYGLRSPIPPGIPAAADAHA